MPKDHVANTTHGSLEAYKAAKDSNYKTPTSGDPFEKLYRPGWFWTGQIIEAGAGPALPYTVKVESPPEVKKSVKKGWRPLLDADGRPGIPAEVVGLFAAFYAGKDVPPAIAELLKAAKPAEPPKPAK